MTDSTAVTTELLAAALAAYAEATTSADTDQVVRLLATAITDAVRGAMQGVEIGLEDQDGSAWLYRHAALPGAEPPRYLGPVARYVQ